MASTDKGKSGAFEPKSGPAAMNPGDQAPPGTPGTGEDICPVCHGNGKLEGGQRCPNCGGTGVIIEGIGGA